MLYRVYRVVSLAMISLVYLSPSLSHTAFAQGCPELIGEWPYGPSLAVAADGNLAYSSTGPTLQIVDLTDPTTPSVIGELDLSMIINGLAVNGDFAFATGGSAGLRVIDVSDPEQPVETGLVAMPGSARDVAASGRTAYVSDMSGLQLVYVTEPTSPVVVGSYTTPGYAMGVSVSSDSVFVADESAGMSVFSDSHLFTDGFESDDTAPWSATSG